MSNAVNIEVDYELTVNELMAHISHIKGQHNASFSVFPVDGGLIRIEIEDDELSYFEDVHSVRHLVLVNFWNNYLAKKEASRESK